MSCQIIFRHRFCVQTEIVFIDLRREEILAVASLWLDIKMAKNAKILFLFSLFVLAVLIKHSQGALLFYFYNFNPTQVPIPSMDEV